MYTLVAFAVKKKLFIALPYLGNLSFAITTGLQDSINKNLPFCKIKVIFKSTTCLSKFSVLKIKRLLTYAVMLFTNSRVVDVMLPIMAELADIKTLRVGTHSGVSPLTGKSLRLKQLLLLKIICFFAIT